MDDQPSLRDEIAQLRREIQEIKTTFGKALAIAFKMQVGQITLDLRRDLGVNPEDWKESIVKPILKM